jgi:hypothetical protein
MALKAGDMLSTGAGSRLLLKLSEGSLVKLGENGSLELKESAAPTAPGEAAVEMDQRRQFYQRGRQGRGPAGREMESGVALGRQAERGARRPTARQARRRSQNRFLRFSKNHARAQ